MYLKNITNIIFVLFLIPSISFAAKPENLRISNVRGNCLTVSWTSVTLEIGKVKYGTNISNYNKWTVAFDDRGANIIDDIHHISLKNIYSNTTYFFELVSGDSVDNNNGEYYQVNSGPVLSPVGGSCMPAGKIFKNKDKTQLAYDTIVYVIIIGESENTNSACESVLVTQESNGYWFVELVNFRTKDYNNYYSYSCSSSKIKVEAQAGNDGFASMLTNVVDYNEKEMPDIIVIPQDLFMDVNKDGSLGLEEAIFILQKLSKH